MKGLILLLLAIGLAHPASLATMNMDIENACDGTDEITIVTVTGSSGNGIEGAYIKVEDISPWKWKTSASGNTDEDGIFEFEGCGDTWNITASYGGYESKTETFTLGGCNSCTSAPPPAPNPPEETENETTPEPPEPDPPPQQTPEPPVQNTVSAPPPTSSENTATTTPEPEEQDDETVEKSGKKPLPCCASSAILFAVSGIVIWARR
jgi:hypothetical protein